ncbi:MAG: SEC-C domain-containing protein [Muribaculaceae bacterium]|nr:SEC-C domain-containing protein [Muribaculaceae bacterium]
MMTEGFRLFKLISTRCRTGVSRDGHQRKMASRQRESKGDGMPVIMPGPGFQAMGINTPEQMMALLDDEEGFSPFGGFPFAQGNRKSGRNDPCPCGSGKKYKNCCGKKSN